MRSARRLKGTQKARRVPGIAFDVLVGGSRESRLSPFLKVDSHAVLFSVPPSLRGLLFETP